LPIDRDRQLGTQKAVLVRSNKPELAHADLVVALYERKLLEPGRQASLADEGRAPELETVTKRDPVWLATFYHR
jgi:hypothetical protein